MRRICDKDIGERLRALRDRNGLTRADLAARSGVSERQLARIEAGGTTPKIGTIASLAAAFNLDAAHFLISRTNEELEDTLSENTCQTCGVVLVQRVPMEFEHSDADLMYSSAEPHGDGASVLVRRVRPFLNSAIISSSSSKTTTIAFASHAASQKRRAQLTYATGKDERATSHNVGSSVPTSKHGSDVRKVTCAFRFTR
jgi:transcriptional regulator with XRE-family HTH domain